VETGTREAIRNSFKATGIWPIDETVYNKQLGPSLMFVDGDGSEDEGADDGMNEDGSDEEEGLLSGDKGGEAENGGSGEAGTGYDAFTAPPFADLWEIWEREEKRNEHREENLGATFSEDNDGFDPEEPPLEPLHP
jgi:hypothetical protein